MVDAARTPQGRYYGEALAGARPDDLAALAKLRSVFREGGIVTAVVGYLRSTLGERFAPPQLLRDKVADGQLGRKTGRGFHAWNE